MDSFEREPGQIHDIPQYQELTSMLARSAEMREALEDDRIPSEVIKNAYVSGLALLDKNVKDLAESPELQDNVALLGARCLARLCDLKLEDAAEPDEERDSKVNSLRQTIQSVKEYFETYGVLTNEASSIVLAIANVGATAVSAAMVAQARSRIEAQAKAKRRAKQPEVITEKPEVILELGQRGLLIGRTKSVNRYPTYDSIADACKRILCLLIDSPADRWSITDALEELDIKLEDLGKGPKYAIADIRDWLNGNVYKDKQLVVRYGQSVNTEYGWTPDFKPRIVSNGDSQPEAESPEEPDDGPTASQVLEAARQAKIKAQEEAKKLEDELDLIEGLHASSLCYTAFRLKELADVFEGHGLAMASDELVDAMRAYRPKDVKKLGRGLKDYKQQAYEEVLSIFDDSDRRRELVDHVTEEGDKTVIEFVTFLTDLMDSADDKTLVRRIITSEPKGTVRIVGKSGNVSYERVLIDDHGYQLWPILSKRKRLPKEPASQPEQKPASEPQVPTPQPGPRSEVGTRPAPDPAKATARPPASVAKAPQPVAKPLEHLPSNGNGTNESTSVRRDRRAAIGAETEAARRRGKHQRKQFDRVKDKVADKITDIVEEWAKHFNLDEKYRLGLISDHFNNFRPSAVYHARGKRIVSSNRSETEFSVRQVIQVILKNDRGLQNVIGHRPNQRAIDMLVERAIDKAQNDQGQ